MPNRQRFTRLMRNAVLVVTPETAATDYYVDSVSGSDANNGLTTGTPFQTLAQMKTIHGAATNRANVYVKAPVTTPLRESLTWDKTAHLAIQPWPGDSRWYLFGVTTYAISGGGWTSDGGGVYHRTLAGLNASALVYDASTADPDSKSVADPGSTDPTYPVLDGDIWTKLLRDVTTPTTPAAGKHGYSGTTLYVHLADGGNPDTRTIHVGTVLYGVIATGSGEVTLTDGTVHGCVTGNIGVGNGAASGTGKLTAINMRSAYGAAAGGCLFTTNRWFSATFINCVAWSGGNDGFNIHGLTGESPICLVKNCESYYGTDENISPHEDVQLRIDGGIFRRSYNSGLAAVTNSTTRIFGGALFDRNARNSMTPTGILGGLEIFENASIAVEDATISNNKGRGIYNYGTGTATKTAATVSGVAAGNETADAGVTTI